MTGEQDQSGGQGLGGRQRRRGRRHRRVDAPPTNPEADRSDDVPAGGAAAVPAPGVAKPESGDARDTWIQEQRPPHWD